MHGKNELRKQDLREDGRLQIHEVFLTIQGEGPWAGHRAVFIRTTGCMLRCYWCDTEWNDKDDPWFEPAVVLQKVNELWGPDLDRRKLVVITGGDPMRQNIVPAIKALMDAGYHVQIETAGVYWVPGLEDLMPERISSAPWHVDIVCSPKTASVHEMIESRCGYWKYIIRAGELSAQDGLPVKSTQMPNYKMKLFRPKDYRTIYVQPCDDGNADKNRVHVAAAVHSALTYGYSLCIQIHKAVGLP